MTIQFPNVKSGDLIKADAWNLVLQTLTAFDGRISALEEAAVNPQGVVISSLQPSSTMHVGQVLTLVGKNFVSPAVNNNVLVAGTPITSDLFKFTSNESQLVFTLPSVPNLAALTQPVTVQVTNLNGSASAPLTLQPAIVAPTGRIEVAYFAAPVMPIGNPNIQTGVQYVFSFSVTTYVTADSTYQITPTMQGWNPQLLNDNDNNPRSSNVVSVPAGVNGVTRYYRIGVTAPAAPNTATLELDVLEMSGFGQVTPGSTTVPNVAVNSQPPTPENRVRVSLRSVAPAPAQIVGNTVQFTRNNAGAISLNFAFTVNGAFALSADLSARTGWLAPGAQIPLQPTSANVPPAGQDATVVLNPGAGAGDTDLILTITSTAGVNPPLAVNYIQHLSVIG
jgi:hypothetical protein